MEKKNLISNFKESITTFFKRDKKKSIFKPKLFSPKKIPYGPFKFQIKMIPGIMFQICVSTNLTTWIPIANEKATAEEMEFVDSDASKFSYRFYRVLTEDSDSENVIGYATLNIPPGYAMIANQFKSEDNTISALLSDMPDGSSFSKFDSLLFKLNENRLNDGKWSKPNDMLNPGEGGIIFNPTDEYRPLTFCGEVMQGQLLNPIPAGFSIKSSILPQAGRLTEDLQFPIAEGDIVHLFDRDKQKYNVYQYDAKEWASNPPMLGIGESFWIGKKSPANWIRNFTVS